MCCCMEAVALGGCRLMFLPAADPPAYDMPFVALHSPCVFRITFSLLLYFNFRAVVYGWVQSCIQAHSQGWPIALAVSLLNDMSLLNR